MKEEKLDTQKEDNNKMSEGKDFEEELGNSKLYK